MLTAVFLACVGDEPGSPAEDTGPTSALAHPYEEAGNAAVVDPALLQSELQALVDTLRSYNATPVLDSWAAVRAYGDANCPSETITESEANGTTTYFERLCIANDVTYFKGPMTVYDFTENTLLAFEVADVQTNVELDGSLWTGRLMKGQTDIYEPGSTLDYNCSCTAALASSSTNAIEQWWTYTDGPTHWSGPEDDGTWMDRGVQSNLYQHYAEYTDAGYWWVRVRGAVTGHADVYGSVELDIMLGGPTTAPQSCAPSSTAQAVMRHTDTGRSTPLVFTFEGGVSCSACAPVDGGEVCVDFAPLHAWEGSPW
jgi:hypothetical protein